jgi:hypothetical protein
MGLHIEKSVTRNNIGHTLDLMCKVLHGYLEFEKSFMMIANRVMLSESRLYYDKSEET